MESQSLSQAVTVVTGDRIQGSPESLEKRRSGGGHHEPFTRPGKVPGHLFPTVGRSIEDVRIEDIQSINRIPDPINPTSAERPYLAKTEKGYFCIDNDRIKPLLSVETSRLFPLLTPWLLSLFTAKDG